MLPNGHQSVSRSGVVSRFPLLSGVIASASFLAVSFLVLAMCLIPALRWHYIEGGPAIPKAGQSARPRALPDVLGDKRVRRRSLKRSGSVGPVKREVWSLILACAVHPFIPIVIHIRITKVVSPRYPLQKLHPPRYAAAV
jgi:hypothetical protein